MVTGTHAPETLTVTHRETIEDTQRPSHVAPDSESGGFIAWLADVSCEDVARVGGKGANLGELTRAGLPVPPGFVVTADAYLSALDRAAVREGLCATASPRSP